MHCMRESGENGDGIRGPVKMVTNPNPRTREESAAAEVADIAVAPPRESKPSTLKTES
jgi:hypothetical protein